MGKHGLTFTPAQAEAALQYLRNECTFLDQIINDNPTPHDLDWAFTNHIDGCANCEQLVLDYYRNRA